MFYTLLLFFGLHPLCGIGVISEIDTIFKPADLRALIEEILPIPGPFKNTETSLSPAW
jgi:hypothetical protein